MNAGRSVRGLVAVVVTAIAALGIARASSYPMSLRDGHATRLRLSWNARPERIEICRTLSEEELAKREVHMRLRVQCEGRFASYALRLEVDGLSLDSAVVRGGGLRHDRALYVLRDFPLSPGVRRIRVTFTRREAADTSAIPSTVARPAGPDSGLFAGRAQREADERLRRARAAIPPRLELDTVVTLAAERVAIVTIDPSSRSLRLVAERQ